MFAFASRNGVHELLQDPEVQRFLSSKPFSLVVGIDAITNRTALERLQEAEAILGGLTVRVFRNPAQGLFHPKLAHFSYPTGAETLIVGSGNLTPGGLRENFEAYSVVKAPPGQHLDLSGWDGFLNRHAANLTPIDTDALERAAKNVFKGGGKRRRDVEPDVVTVVDSPPSPESLDVSRVLIAQIPRAGGRWHQVHFNKDVVRTFFRVKPNSPQRVFLQERHSTGQLEDWEPPRPSVLSKVNLNYKIELGARAGEEYPTGNKPPIAVFLEKGLRTFEYMMVMPGEGGYEELHGLTVNLPKVGRGLPRVITQVSNLRPVSLSPHRW